LACWSVGQFNRQTGKPANWPTNKRILFEQGQKYLLDKLEEYFWPSREHTERMKTSAYYQTKKVTINTLIHLFLLTVAASCLFPLLWMVSSSLKTQQGIFRDMSLWPHGFHFENYYLAWIEGGFGRYFLNSIFYTAAVVIGIAVVSSLAAYAFSRLRFPGKNVLFIMLLAAMMIPVPGSFVPLYVLLNKLHLRNTAVGYILCMINAGLSTSIFLLKTFFDKMPRELEDAARIDGCSKLGVWWHVALPFARPMLAVVVVFNALNVWNEYVLALIIFDSKALMPLQRALMMFQGEFLTNYPLLMAGLTITALPIIVVYLVMQKYIIKGIAAETIFG
jgi:multiple sugar transport system permease protein/raffinose/stachyose/melibiose transport system permease protein